MKIPPKRAIGLIVFAFGMVLALAGQLLGGGWFLAGVLVGCLGMIIGGVVFARSFLELH